MTARRLLILGGTGEAAVLARAVPARFGDTIDVTTSLAGRTRDPGPIPGNIRIGGFGGAAGLGPAVGEDVIDRLIDWTLPCAAVISQAARVAGVRAGVPRLLLLRPRWGRHPLDRWIEVDSVEAAASLVCKVGRCALLTVGAGSAAAFAGVEDVRFVVRLIDPPRQELPLRKHQIVYGRGPFSLPEERLLLRQYGVDVLVCKASGGAATEAKLIAAREAGVPVIMVRRPPREPGNAVESVAAALDWLAGPDRRQQEGRMT
jgi:precorrin-6A/cobalt-precorrin-6A reductase